MDYRSLTKLLTKIGGLFVILYALNQLSSSFGVAYQLYSKQQDLLSALIVGAVPVLFPLALGLVLFHFPGVVTNRLLQSDTELNGIDGKSIARVEEAGLALLAIYILVHSFGDAAYWLSRIKLYHVFIESEKMMPGPPLLPEDFAQLVAVAAQIILAIALFFNASGLVCMKDKLRGRIDE
jgi:hypothetical protein